MMTLSTSPVAVSVLVATGLVVVGEIVGSGEAQERGVVGGTPNRAACLQGVAAPNTVVIAEGTRRLLGNLFELEDLGPKGLKGGPDGVRIVTASDNNTVRLWDAATAKQIAVLRGHENTVRSAVQPRRGACLGRGENPDRFRRARITAAKSVFLCARRCISRLIYSYSIGLFTRNGSMSISPPTS